MNRRSDVMVIGGGIVGLWTAKNLLRHGCSVTIVERGKLGSGASSGNCGYICPSHVHPLAAPGAVANGLRMMFKTGGALSIPPRWDPTLWRWLLSFAKRCNEDDFHTASIGRDALLRSSRARYQEFAQDHADSIKWQERGLLMVYRSPRDFDAYETHAKQLRTEFGLEINRHDSNGLCVLEPTLRDDLAGGWHFPGDAHVCPSRVLDELRREIVASGGTIKEHTEVQEFVFDRHRVTSVRTVTGQTLAADAFVLTTGAEAGVLGKQLRCRIPVVPGKGYSVTIDDATGMPSVPMIFEDDHVAVTPLGNAFRIGSTMQLTGFDRRIPPARIELLKRSAREHLRNPLPQAQEQLWSGWRPMMPDGLPCIDQSPRAGNAFVAAGNGMIGMASGPATGQLAAELTLGLAPHLDPTPYRLGRFAKAGKTSATPHWMNPQAIAESP